MEESEGLDFAADAPRLQAMLRQVCVLGRVHQVTFLVVPELACRASSVWVRENGPPDLWIFLPRVYGDNSVNAISGSQPS